MDPKADVWIDKKALDIRQKSRKCQSGLSEMQVLDTGLPRGPAHPCLGPGGSSSPPLENCLRDLQASPLRSSPASPPPHPTASRKICRKMEGRAITSLLLHALRPSWLPTRPCPFPLPSSSTRPGVSHTGHLQCHQQGRPLPSPSHLISHSHLHIFSGFST